MFHQPSAISLRASTAGDQDEALQMLHLLLRAKVEAAAKERNPSSETPIVRRYTLGHYTKVKDVRTGRATSKLEHVLKGHLDCFLIARPAPVAAKT